MGNSKNKQKTVKPLHERYTLTNIICNYYLVIVFTLFPLYVNTTFTDTFPFISFAHGFSSIRHQKYYFFLVITALAVIAEIMLLITKSSNDAKKSDPSARTFLNMMSFTDWAVIAFILTCAISTAFSEHINMAVTGETSIIGSLHGRNNGMILMLFYAAVYFLITRCFRFKEYVFIALAAASGIIYLLAVLNGFYLDPLGILETFKGSSDQSDIRFYNEFMTTIGNKNMFSSVICVTLPVIISMFVYTKKLWCRAVYLSITVLGSMAAVICDSDSVVLGLGAFIMVFTTAYSRDPIKLRKFLLAITVMFLSVKLLWLISLLSGEHYKELSAVPYKIMLSNATFYVIAALALITAALYIVTLKTKISRFPLAVPIALGSLFGIAVLAGLGTIIYFTFINTTADLGEKERVLRYSDAWGTHRGFMWNKSLEAFGGFNVFNKLFGTGPETLFYTFSPYFGELAERFGDGSTDAAHNEYINYLLNIGIFGLLSYLTFVGSALAGAFRAAKKNPIALVFASAVVAYLAQAVVNIALPIATPLFIVFVSLCETAKRQTKNSVINAEKERKYEKQR